MPKWTRKYRLQGDGNVYTVSTDEEGKWGCSCPGWIFKSLKANCKHIEQIRVWVDELGKAGDPVGVRLSFHNQIAFVWDGSNLLEQAEMLLGVAREEWVILHTGRWFAPRACAATQGFRNAVGCRDVFRSTSARFEWGACAHYTVVNHQVGLPRQAGVGDIHLEVFYPGGESGQP